MKITDLLLSIKTRFEILASGFNRVESLEEDHKIYNLDTWEPNHPAGTTYTLNEITGVIVATFPNGKTQAYKLLS